MSRRERDDRGSVTGFVVGLTLALVLCAGLVFDGGRLVAARIGAADAAENAARAGAQEIVDIRAGSWRLDPDRARARAEAYLAAEGAVGSVAADDTEVSVTVGADTRMTLLALIGIGTRHVEATRTARPVER